MNYDLSVKGKNLDALKKNFHYDTNPDEYPKFQEMFRTRPPIVLYSRQVYPCI